MIRLFGTGKTLGNFHIIAPNPLNSLEVIYTPEMLLYLDTEAAVLEFTEQYGQDQRSKTRPFGLDDRQINWPVVAGSHDLVFVEYFPRLRLQLGWLNLWSNRGGLVLNTARVDFIPHNNTEVDYTPLRPPQEDADPFRPLSVMEQRFAPPKIYK